MMSVLTASHLHALRPQSRGITFAVRPPSAPSRTLSRSSHPSTVRSSSTQSVLSAPDHTLTLLDIERIFYQRVAEKEEELSNAFKVLDSDQNFTVTKGEFKRVIETFLLPLTQAQFEVLLSKIPVNSNGTVSYLNFLKTYSVAGMHAGPENPMKRCWSATNQNMTLNQLEYKLKHKISANLKNVVRSFKLFDYNQNGHLQRHELRRILENYCFKMRDAEFEKLWSRYCIGTRNTIDYKHLLQNLGINVDINKRPIQESVEQALNWEATHQELLKQKTWRPASSAAEHNMEDYSIDDIEMAFRKKAAVSHHHLVKACKAFDITHSGLISTEALKSVINSFIFPLRNEVFQELINRFGFEASGKISWEQFLEKCKNPMRYENGKITGSPNVPSAITLQDDVFCSDHVLRRMQRLMGEAYPSLRKAFFMLDDKHDGKITRREFRRIVDCTVFRIRDDQFKELMIILDPGHTGFINYHKFLQLFEESSPTVEQNGLYNPDSENKKPSMVQAWDTAEDILRDKISENLLDFQRAVFYYDSKGKGVISRNKLRKIILTYCPSLLEDHFSKLCHRCCDSSDGIYYMDFLKHLGVDIDARWETESTDSQSAKEHQQSKGIRQHNTSDSHKETLNHTNPQLKKKTKDGAVRNLKEFLAQKNIPVGNILLSIIKQPNGTINKAGFRKVLEENGMFIDDANLGSLTENLGFTEKGLNYLDFASLLEDPNHIKPAASPCEGLNHRVNNSEFHQMTAETCLTKLMNALKQASKDIYSIFLKTDRNHDGIISMHDMRGLLESFALIVTDMEFIRLLNVLGLNMRSTLNYKEFCDLFQAEERKKTNGQLNSSYRQQSVIGDGDLACEQAHQYLVTKARHRWHDLAKNFQEFNRKGETIVQKKDVRKLFYKFALPIAPNDYETLWARYDTDGKGYLTQEEFLQKLGVQPSSDILHHNCISFTKDNSQTPMLQSEMEEQQNQQCESPGMEDAEPQIKVGDSVHDSQHSYVDFLGMIKEDKEYKCGQRQEAASPEICQMLSAEKTFSRIKEIITSSYDVLHKAFSLFDKQKTGTVSQENFLQVLESFCFKLTEKQLKYLLTRLTCNENRQIHWKAFLQDFNLSNSDDANRRDLQRAAVSLSVITKAPIDWSERVEKLIQPKSTSEPSMKDILTRIQEVVTGRFYTIAQEFSNIDYAKISVISKEDFRDICNRNFMFLTDKQFENLWNVLPINAYGNLEYHEFLKKYSGDASKIRPPSSNARSQSSCKASSPARSVGRSASLPRRPKTAPCVLRRSQTPDKMQRPGTAVPCATPVLNYEAIEMKLRKNVHKKWQDILKACREKDTEQLGEITVSDFLAIEEKFNMDLSKEEAHQLITKYDIRNNGTFSYSDFLRDCVLLTKQPENPLLQRMKLQQPRIPMSAGLEGPLFVGCMVRIQPRILQCWRPMRRSFLSVDTGTGYISVQDFKQVLREYSINLTEDEFFHILGFYDKDLTLKISYNDFLRSFLG